MSLVMEIAAAILAAGAVFFVVVFGFEMFRAQVEKAEESKPKRRRRDEEEKPGQLRLIFLAWARRLAPILPKGMRAELQRNITMAGGLAGLTPAQLVLWALFAGLVGLTIAVLIVLATGWPIMVVAGVTVGATLIPFIWIRDQVKRRHLEILADLPYHLDLLTLCVEAGLDFGAGVARMVDKGKPGPLREEFQAFLGEIRIGKTRAEAMESMSERVGLVPLSNFLSALVQADRMGSGIGKTLRLQADQLRTERFQRAEKLASEAPVKMLIPLVIFIFPTIWIILGAPLVFEWIFRGAP